MLTVASGDNAEMRPRHVLKALPCCRTPQDMPPDVPRHWWRLKPLARGTRRIIMLDVVTRTVW
jgi:hypothetical protein